jgi:hypothetical protein
VLSVGLRIVSVAICALIVISFVMFASDDINAASKQQVALLNSEDTGAPTAAQQNARDNAHGSVGGAIDDASQALLSPFAGVVSSSNRWVQRGVPLVIGLLLYGFVLAYIARLAKTRGI